MNADLDGSLSLSLPSRVLISGASGGVGKFSIQVRTLTGSTFTFTFTFKFKSFSRRSYPERLT
jgi:NADPH:quinone reductase-like Zn-dependent oxidoreductase